jgi:hypothetical protein
LAAVHSRLTIKIIAYSLFSEVFPAVLKFIWKLKNFPRYHRAIADTIQIRMNAAPAAVNTQIKSKPNMSSIKFNISNKSKTAPPMGGISAAILMISHATENALRNPWFIVRQPFALVIK